MLITEEFNVKSFNLFSKIVFISFKKIVERDIYKYIHKIYNFSSKLIKTTDMTEYQLIKNKFNTNYKYL